MSKSVTSEKSTSRKKSTSNQPINATITLRVTPEYKAIIRAKAKEKGLTQQNYILLFADDIIRDLDIERPLPPVPVIDRKQAQENLLETIPRVPYQETQTSEKKKTDAETIQQTSIKKTAKERTTDINTVEKRLRKSKRKTMLKFSGIGLFVMILIIGLYLFQKGKISQGAIMKGMIGGATIGYFGYLFFGRNSEIDKVKDVDPDLLKYIPIRK